jgi:hypothetical protein
MNVDVVDEEMARWFPRADSAILVSMHTEYLAQFFPLLLHFLFLEADPEMRTSLTSVFLAPCSPPVPHFFVLDL